MNCILSIQKKYADLIFDGIKPFEFRNVLPKLKKNDVVFLYETKKTGCGKIVGFFTVDSIHKIDYNNTKIGTYLFIDTYAKMFCSEKVQESVRKVKNVELENYYNSYALDFLFEDDIVEKMIETHQPPQREFAQKTQEELKKYNNLKQKQTNFLRDCDNWLTKIGFYNENQESTWKYQINIKNSLRFQKPRDIEQFRLKNGEKLTKGPQSFCYVL